MNARSPTSPAPAHSWPARLFHRPLWSSPSATRGAAADSVAAEGSACAGPIDASAATTCATTGCWFLAARFSPDIAPWGAPVRRCHWPAASASTALISIFLRRPAAGYASLCCRAGLGCGWSLCAGGNVVRRIKGRLLRLCSSSCPFSLLLAISRPVCLLLCFLLFLPGRSPTQASIIPDCSILNLISLLLFPIF